MPPTEQPDFDDLLGTDDHLAAERVFLGPAAHQPGDTVHIAGLALYLHDAGVWRIHRSHDDLEAAYDEDDPSRGYLDTIDPTEFRSANQIYDYLRGLAEAIESHDNEGSPDTLQADQRPEVH